MGAELHTPRLLRRALSIRPPDAPGAAEWLDAFYAEQRQRECALRAATQPAAAAALLQAAAPAPSCEAAPAAEGGVPRKRRNLLLAAVGDTWTPRWVQVAPSLSAHTPSPLVHCAATLPARTECAELLRRVQPQEAPTAARAAPPCPARPPGVQVAGAPP